MRILILHARPMQKQKNKFYNTYQWQRLRNAYLKSHPLCVMCEKESKTKRANEIDHIIPINKGGSAIDWANLQSLCKHHHSQKTRKENTKKKAIETRYSYMDIEV